jgi:hypothetical protein
LHGTETGLTRRRGELIHEDRNSGTTGQCSRTANRTNPFNYKIPCRERCKDFSFFQPFNQQLSVVSLSLLAGFSGFG